MCCGVTRKRGSTTGMPRPGHFHPDDQGRASVNCYSRNNLYQYDTNQMREKLRRRLRQEARALQPSPEIRWQDLIDDIEKYKAYLASRDWVLKVNAVRERSGGYCERRCGNKATQVHHQTYIRLYNERLEDLLHVCGPCHAYLSGKIHTDPTTR